MRQISDYPPDTRRRAIIAATAALLLVLWCEVTAIAKVSARSPEEEAMLDDERLRSLKYTFGYLDVSTAAEALRFMSAVKLPLHSLVLAKPHMRQAAQQANWDPAHPSAATWLENVHAPHWDAGDQQIYFRAACIHAGPCMPDMMSNPRRSRDAFISFGNTIRPPLPEDHVAELLQQLRGSLDTQADAAALNELGIELARARAAETARGWQQTLTRTRDVIHDDLFSPLCLTDDERESPENAPPQHCHRYRWLTTIFRYDTISWAIMVIVFQQAYRSLLCYEYGPSIQVILTIAVARLLRVTCFAATTLPVIMVECRLAHDGIQNGGGCGDYLFSGHAVMQFVTLCMIWDGHLRQRPRWPLSLLLLATIASGTKPGKYSSSSFRVCTQIISSHLRSIGHPIFLPSRRASGSCSLRDGCWRRAGVALFGYTLERYHYTVDVLLAGYLTVGAWMGATS